MPRYIDIENLNLKGIAVFDENLDVLIPLSYVRKAIQMTPTADVVEVKHGEWIDKTWTTECDWCEMKHNSITCSVCKEEIYKGAKTKYCPECGAKMDNKLPKGE